MTARSLGERFYRRATSIYRGARTSIYWRATSIIGGAPHIYCVVPRQNIDAIDEIDAINAINAINAITSIYKRVYLYKRLSRSRYTSRKSKIVPNTPDLRTACQINKSTARINTTRVRRLPGAAQTHAKKRQAETITNNRRTIRPQGREYHDPRGGEGAMPPASDHDPRGGRGKAPAPEDYEEPRRTTRSHGGPRGMRGM